MTNPLLDPSPLPAFDRITAAHAEPAIDSLLAQSRERLEQILAAPGPRTWSGFVVPLEVEADRLGRAWSAVNHLHSVADNEALRAAYNRCLPKLTDFHTELGQHRGLFDAYRALAAGAEYAGLDPVQRRVIDNALRDFRLSGVELAGRDRERYREVRSRLATLEARFDENLLDATHAFTRHVTDADELAGLPESALALAAQQAREAGRDGWLFNLEIPSYLPIMQYAENAALRREMYEAFVTRASEQGPHAGRWDNGAVMVEILKLRRELASLLGFESYAHLSLEKKMAQSPEQVCGFLEDLAQRSCDMARRELEELRAFAAEHAGTRTLEAWDIPFYSERLRRERYAFSQEDLRPYFPVPRVIEGMFAVVGRLYGVTLKARTGVSAWHPDVGFYDIFDEQGELRGGFYLDLYARAHKRGGAWMDECRVRARLPDGLQQPVAYLTCNFTPPVGDTPSLLTHDEVETLFHEFGHGLHHLLTRIDHAPVSGINGVAWDAVELPSQIMENWCWEAESLALVAGHYRTGETLPGPLLERMRRARKFQSGMQMVRQLEFAMFDFELHLAPPPDDTAAIQRLLNAVRARVAVVRPPAFNRFQHGFSHIFSGGYAAGYYSYKWAEVLSADAFSMFEENGIFDPGTGRLFLHSILEQGGARDPMELFVAFRGREPSIEALLRHSGIAPAVARNA